MEKLKFGTSETTVVIDDNGSTETQSENIRDGAVVLPVRRTYAIKTRVHSRLEEKAVYDKFSLDNETNPKRLDTSFKIERSKIGDLNGFYYTVECYTQLVY